MEKATRADTVKRLKVLRQMERANPCGNGFRFYLDRIIGGYLFYEGALPTNWGSTPKKLRDLIRKSLAVQVLANGGRPEAEIKKLIVLEHAYTMSELRTRVLDKEYDSAIDSYDVRFITREEDERLKDAQRSDCCNLDRYVEAGIKFD